MTLRHTNTVLTNWMLSSICHPEGPPRQLLPNGALVLQLTLAGWQLVLDSIAGNGKWRYGEE
jgi:hypothetical protein